MKKIAFCGLALALLSACAGDGEKKIEIPRSCPQVAIIRELQKIMDHGQEAVTPETFVAGAQMRHLEGLCSYKDDGVEMTFDVAFAAEKGARLGGNRIGFPYFISIVNPKDEIISKEIMTIDLAFPSGKNVTQKKEPLRVFLPLAKDENAGGYRVLMGFQLTEAQLNAVREGK